jgi:hypothetical protein
MGRLVSVNTSSGNRAKKVPYLTTRKAKNQENNEHRQGENELGELKIAVRLSANGKI